MSEKSTFSVAVCQLGARLHYGAARAFERKGVLAQLQTDICGTSGWPRVLQAVPKAARPAAVQKLLGRDPVGLPRKKIKTFDGLGLAYSWRIGRCRSEAERIRMRLELGDEFGERVAKTGFAGATHAYAFSTAALKIVLAARSAGLHTILEQPGAPGAVEQEIMREEWNTFPRWEKRDGCDEELQSYINCQREEWDVVDTIVAPSEFVAAGLRSVGVPPNRCVVVPYGVDHSFGQVVRRPHAGRLRVLTVGAVRLQKGVQYTMEAAKLLGKGVEFRVVGPSKLSRSATRQLAEVVDLVGSIPRSVIKKQYEWADVFLLPSLCEGQATVLLEALAAGLPVITTPNAGGAIRDGVEGFVVPIRDPQAIAGRLDRIAADRILLAEMSRNAKLRAEDFTLDAYAERLYHAVEERTTKQCEG